MASNEKSTNCNITFIIGNGFDLNLNMQTKYSDMYNGYISEPSIISYINKFKKALNEHTPSENWGDFELWMAEYAKNLSSETELIECVRDFKRYLVEHLSREEKRVNNIISEGVNYAKTVPEIKKSFGEFYLGLIPNDINAINSVIMRRNKSIRIITFNYTSVLETLLGLIPWTQQLNISEPIHIHGSLNEEVILGVDNINQLKDVPYDISRKAKRAFVKTEFNEQFDKQRVSQAKYLISSSDIICTFGFAMGQTDQTWVQLMVDWLRKDPKHHLVHFEYDEKEYHKCNRDEIMDVEEEKKHILLKRFGIEGEELFDQIHIPVGNTIFNLEEIKNKTSYILAPII